MSDTEDTLDILLVKSTSLLSKEPDQEAVEQLIKIINKDKDVSQRVLRFLAHKMQSPQEKEALMSLTVLEECAAHCGTHFHNEIGKFRFLNEMIKVVSPKYLGDRTSKKVQRKVYELIFKWTLELRESKILDAYLMLKKQHYIPEDLENSANDEKYTFPKQNLCQDEKKTQALRELAQSTNRVDIQAANRLIKEMIEESQLAERTALMESVHKSIEKLQKFIEECKLDKLTQSEKIKVKELHEEAKGVHLQLFKAARDLNVDDKGLGEILKLNYELSSLINVFKETIGKFTADDLSTPDIHSNELQLMDLSSPQDGSSEATMAMSLDEQLLSLGLNEIPSKNSNINHDNLSLEPGNHAGQGDSINTFFSRSTEDSTLLSRATNLNRKPVDSFSSGSPVHMPATPPNSPYHKSDSCMKSGILSCAKFTNESLKIDTNEVNGTFASTAQSNHKDDCVPTTSRALEDLNALGEIFMQNSLSAIGASKSEFSKSPKKMPLNHLQKTSVPASPVRTNSSTSSDTASCGQMQNMSPVHCHIEPLDNVFVSLETISPGNITPLTLYDNNGLSFVIHFGDNHPRTDVFVMVLTITNKNPYPADNIQFQAAVSRNMKIKLQPLSAANLSKYLPFQSPPVATQVILIANPSNEKIHLRYRLGYCIKGTVFEDSSELMDLLGGR